MSKSARILIVEDEQLVAADLESKLQRLGHLVVGNAASGQEALRLAEQERPDVILMDIQLQGKMDGIEVARTLKKTIQFKVIFVSAFGQLSGLAEETASAVRFLTKPFSYVQLQAALDATLREGTGI